METRSHGGRRRQEWMKGEEKFYPCFSSSSFVPSFSVLLSSPRLSMLLSFDFAHRPLHFFFISPFPRSSSSRDLFRAARKLVQASQPPCFAARNTAAVNRPRVRVSRDLKRGRETCRLATTRLVGYRSLDATLWRVTERNGRPPLPLAPTYRPIGSYRLTGHLRGHASGQILLS